MIKRIGSHINKFGILFVGYYVSTVIFLFAISPDVAPDRERSSEITRAAFAAFF